MLVEKGGGLQTYSDGTFFIKSPLRGNCGGLWRNGEAMGEVWKDVELLAQKVGQSTKKWGIE